MNFPNIECPACAKARSTKRAAFPNYAAYECTECGLNFGVPDVAVDGSSFDSYSWTKEWTKNFPGHVEKARYSLERKLEIMKGISGYPVTSMLDIGCGNGAFLAAGNDLGIYAEGTDIDREHTQFAIAQGLKAFHCDILDYQTDREFDLIHMKESFHLVMNSKEFVERTVKLMNDRTILYLDSTHADGLASRFRKRFISPPRYGQLYPTLHNRAFNRQSFSYILEHAGLRVVKFISFNRGDRIYCPAINLSVRKYVMNPLLDLAFLGGFIGVYAMKKASSA